MDNVLVEGRVGRFSRGRIPHEVKRRTQVLNFSGLEPRKTGTTQLVCKEICMRTTNKHSPVWVESQPLLQEWYASALGQSILAQLDQHLSIILPAVFGYQGLQLGSLGSSTSFLEKAGIHRTLLLDSPNTPVAAEVGKAATVNDDSEDAGSTAADSGQSRSESRAASPLLNSLLPNLSADVLNLPIANDVMKIVVLPHTLDFSDDPYQVLREVDRVLTADGHMVIIGFSPWSQFGLRRSIIRWRRSVPWNGSFYSRSRVTDWLSVLNYRVHDSQAFFLRPPLQSAKILERMKLLEKNQRWLGLLGGLYLLHVRKQTLPMTPAKRIWLPQRQHIRVGSFVRAREPGAATTAARQVSQTVKAEKPDT